MKPLEYRFSLDMNDEAAQVFCNVRNGDDCSKLIVSLQEDGRAYTFDDDVHAYFLAKKSDGNSLYTECSVENNTIIYEFTEQTAPVSGTVVCQFLLLSASNRLTTPIFRLEVFDNVSIDPDSPQSLPEYTALIDATQDAIDATDDMRDLIEEIEYKLEHGEFKGDPGPQGPQGIQGPQGAQGIQGPTGADGYSPTATVTKSGNTATITITDKNGTTTAEIEDGAESVADVSPLGTSSSLIPNIDTATRSDVLYRVWADATSYENNDTLGWIIFCGDLDFPTVKQFYFRYNALIMQRVGAVSNGVVSWGEWEAANNNNATVINEDTVPASVNWQGVIPNTYAGRTGQIGELALYADYSTFWYMAAADPQSDYYEWYKVLNTDDLYSLMKLAPLNPTAQEIATLSNGQLYGDTVNHKGVIKGGQEFYDSVYIDENTYTKTEIDNIIGAISTLSFEVVQSKPVSDIKTNVIYLVPKSTAETDNVYEEWIYVNNAWELIGTTEIDLSDYALKATTLAGYGITDAYDKTYVNNNFSKIIVSTKRPPSKKVTGDIPWKVGTIWIYDDPYQADHIVYTLREIYYYSSTDDYALTWVPDIVLYDSKNDTPLQSESGRRTDYSSEAGGNSVSGFPVSRYQAGYFFVRDIDIGSYPYNNKQFYACVYVDFLVNTGGRQCEYSYTWKQILTPYDSYTKTEIDSMIGDIETLLSEV